MKDLIGWGSFLALLFFLSGQLAEILEKYNLVGYVVASTLIFSWAFSSLKIKFVKKNPAKKKKPVSWRARGRRDPVPGTRRPNGSTIPERYRTQNPN